MSKEARLKVTWCDSDNAYRVSVPPRLSSTGKREQKSFKKKADALVFAEQVKARKDNFGILLSGQMSPAQVAEAAEALNLLAPINVSLLDAVREYLRVYEHRSQSVSLEQLFEQFIASRSTKKKREQELRQTLSKFADKTIRVCDLDQKHIQAAFTSLTNSSLESHLRKLGTVLNYGKQKGYLTENPVDRIDKPEVERDEVQVASVETVRALFADALANDREMIPFLTFTFFCGIRTGGEIERLDWSNIRAGEVVLRGKTGMKRAIPLSECATAWLNRYVQLGGIAEGKVVKWSKDQLFDHRRRNWKAAGYDAIPQDIARHTFCSHYLAKTGDLTKSLLASGHTDPKVFWQHYYQHVTAEEVAAFWSIMPPDPATNVVAFPQVA